MNGFTEQCKRIAKAIGSFFVSLWQLMLLPLFLRIGKAFSPQNLRAFGVKIKAGRFNLISIGALSALVVIFVVSIMRQASVGGAGWQSVLFYNPDDYFMDFFNSMSDSEYAGLYTDWGNLYAPIVYIPLNLLMHLIPGYEFLSSAELRASQVGIVSYSVIMLLVQIAFAAVLYREKKGSVFEKAVFVLAVFVSAGMVSTIERGNLVIFAVLYSALFLVLYRSEVWWKREIGYVCLALAVCFKIYPVFLGLLILKEKRFTGAVRCAVYWLVLFIAPFLYYGSMAENILAYFQAVFGFGGIDTAELAAADRIALLADALGGEEVPEIVEEAVFGASGFSYAGTLQILFAKLYGNYTTLDVSMRLGNGLFVVALVFSFFLDRPWKSATMLSILSITFSQNSNTYTLIFLIFPFLMFLNDCSWKNPMHWMYAVLFVCIFGFFTYTEQYFHIAPYHPEWANYYYYLYYANIIERFAILIMTFLLVCEGVFFAILRLEDFVIFLVNRIRKSVLRQRSLREDPYGKKK